MNNSFNVFLVLTALSIIWGFSKFSSYRRMIFGTIGILLSGLLLLYESAINTSDLNFSRIFLISLPALGGMILIPVSFFPILQDGIVEFLGWTLWFSLFSVTIFRWTDLKGQWFITILLMAGVFIVQKLGERPVGEWPNLFNDGRSL